MGVDLGLQGLNLSILQESSLEFTLAQVNLGREDIT